MRKAPEQVEGKLCALAVVAYGLAWSFLLVFFVPWLGDHGEFLVFILRALEISAMVLGIVSLIMIERGGGRLVGRRYAEWGIALPIISFFVMALFMTILTGPRKRAFRMTCGTHLSGLGKAMLIYANDYDDVLPKAGGKDNQWASSIPNWRAAERSDAYGVTGPTETGTVSVSASLYLLVKYAEVTPKQFLCLNRKDCGIEFDLSQYDSLDPDTGLSDVWDFGPDPIRHCDYAYHAPFGDHALTISADPAMAVAADLNPWIPARARRLRNFSAFFPDKAPWQGSLEQARAGNTLFHKDGQNVLFLDSHVGFEKRPFCATDDDNIYTLQKAGDRMRGTAPVPYDCRPANKQDSLLLHDPQARGESVRR